MSDLADALALLRQYQEQIAAEQARMKAEMLLLEFIEAAGGVPEAVAQLERDYEGLQERFEALQDRYDLLRIDAHRAECGRTTVPQDREQHAGHPGDGGPT